MAIPLGIFAKVVQFVWPTLKELLFGKYRVADYLRRRPIIILFMVLFLTMFGLFINMTENALVVGQHYRDTAIDHRVEINKLTQKVDRQKAIIAMYRTRYNTLCAEQTTYDCNMASDGGSVDGQYVIQGGRVVGFVDIPDLP